MKYGKGALKILKDEGVNYKIKTFKAPIVNKTDIISLILYQIKLYFLIKRSLIKLIKHTNLTM